MDRRAFLKEVFKVAGVVGLVSVGLSRREAHAFGAAVCGSTPPAGGGCGVGSGVTIIGTESVETSDFQSSDKITCSRFKALYDCDLKYLYLYGNTNWTAGEGIKMGVYDDSGNLLESETAAVDGDGVEDWEQFTLPTAITLTADDYYWLCFFNDWDAGFRSNTSTGDAEQKSKEFEGYTYASGMPATLDFSSGTTSSMRWSIYGTTA